MLELRKLIEDFAGNYTVSPPSAVNGLDGGSFNIHDMKDPNMLELLDGFVGSIRDTSYLNPYAALRHLNNKMNVVGLRFNDERPIKEGTYLYPMSQFGGRWGKLNDDSYDIGNDDGISHRLGHGLALECTFTKMENNRWQIKANIVPTDASQAMEQRPGFQTFSVNESVKEDGNPKADEATIFINKAKDKFQKLYGDSWKDRLYATAWKKFGN